MGNRSIRPEPVRTIDEQTQTITQDFSLNEKKPSTKQSKSDITEEKINKQLVHLTKDKRITDLIGNTGDHSLVRSYDGINLTSRIKPSRGNMSPPVQPVNEVLYVSHPRSKPTLCSSSHEIESLDHDQNDLIDGKHSLNEEAYQMYRLTSSCRARHEKRKNSCTGSRRTNKKLGSVNQFTPNQQSQLPRNQKIKKHQQHTEGNSEKIEEDEQTKRGRNIPVDCIRVKRKPSSFFENPLSNINNCSENMRISKCLYELLPCMKKLHELLEEFNELFDILPNELKLSMNILLHYTDLINPIESRQKLNITEVNGKMIRELLLQLEKHLLHVQDLFNILNRMDEKFHTFNTIINQITAMSDLSSEN
ncbi:unnamed protein product [Trichobilharzia szidati]|nr:unnamed protein product [Trichobilharzia szidati]